MKLIRVQRLDSIRLDESFFTPEGFFIDSPKVTKVGIFEYKNPDGSIRRELRLPEYVFDKKSLDTYEGKPVIITHDAMRVTKDNVSDEIVGTMISKGYRDSDSDSVRVKVVIHDIDNVKQSGLRELSLGYDLVLDETPGEWKGQPYDAIQTNIVVNHLALVRDARAGDQARLNLDSKQSMKGVLAKMAKKKSAALSGAELQKKIAAYKEKGVTRLDELELILKKEIELDSGAKTDEIPPDIDKNGDAEAEIGPDEKLKLIKEKFDGMSKDSEAPTLDGYLKDIGALLECIEYLQAKYDATLAAEDAKKSDADPDDKETAMNVDSIDAIVGERIRLGRLGDKLNLDGLEEMKPIDAKKAIVKAVLPNMRLDGKSTVYIQAAFDQAVEQVDARKDVNYQRRQMQQRVDGVALPTDKTSAQDARERMMNRMMNGGDE